MLLEKETPDALSGSTPNSTSTYEETIKSCIRSAILQWDLVTAQPRSYASTSRNAASSSPQQLNIARIRQLIQLCFRAKKPMPCAELFDLILKKESVSTQLDALYRPLVGTLHGILTKNNISPASELFRNFFRRVIEEYLVGILGGRVKRSGNAPNVRKVGCGCADCTILDQFMFSKKPQGVIRLRLD
jgi:hypothetical protein